MRYACDVSKRAKPRAPKAPPDVTASRVNHIAGIMRANQWVRGESGRFLADEWGWTLARVERLSAEAWRRVCAEANDAEAARPTIAGYLSTSLASAHGEREYKAVATLADTWSKVVGARAPTQTVEVPLTEEQARAKYKELTGKEWGE